MPKVVKGLHHDEPGPGVQRLPHPPIWFRALRWSCFLVTVGLAIGMLALMNTQLTGISAVYQGGNTAYQGRSIRIQFCMLSSSTDADNAVRCNLGFAVSSVSLFLSFVWSYVQGLRRNPFKHQAARLADLSLCASWFLFWLAAAIILCVWTAQANTAGTFLEAERNQRNGFCVIAWLEFLFVGVLLVTAGLLFSPRCQDIFGQWEANSKQKKLEKEQKHLQEQRATAQKQEAAVAAAAERKPTSTASAGVLSTPAPAAAAAGPAQV